MNIIDIEEFEGTFEQLEVMLKKGYIPVWKDLDRVRMPNATTMTHPRERYLYSGILVREMDHDAFRYDGPNGPVFVKKVDFNGDAMTQSSRYWGVGDSSPVTGPMEVPEDLDLSAHGFLSDTRYNTEGSFAQPIFLVFEDARRVAQRLAMGLDPWTGEPAAGGEE